MCPQPIEGEALVVHYRGRTFTFHAGPCEQHWHDERDNVFATMSPNGALFAESPVLAERLWRGWFGFGIYVLVGLICGTVAAYLAIGRGQSAAKWFFLGLLINVFALILLLLSPRLAVQGPQGVPSGLRKVPVTRAPQRCSHCGAENHPAARRCLACKEDLESSVATEVSAVIEGGQS